MAISYKPFNHMYSKQEASKIKQDFWTRFGQYMKPIQSAGGGKVNWPNYKTGVPDIYFRLRAERSYASVSIELTQAETRQEVFAQFLLLKPMLQEALGDHISWEENTTDDFEKPIARISITLPNVSIFRETDWPSIISFFKTAMIGLDGFWSDARAMFE